jgi:hypothetical protein
MKHLLLFLALISSFSLLPTMAVAKDKRHDDDDWHKVAKDLRTDMNLLQAHWDQVKDRVKHMGGDRRQWDGLQAVRANIDDLNAQLDSGRFDIRDVRARIQQGHDDLLRVQDQLEDKNKHRGGGFYRPN